MRFEDLDVWKRAARLSAQLYRHLANLRDYGFRDQITRSGLSVASNIAEGYERHSVADRVKFLNYAMSSCAELRTHLYIGMQAELIRSDLGRAWIHETREVSAMLHSLIQTLRK